MSKNVGNSLHVIGQYTQEFNDLLGKDLPCGEIYQSDGLGIHIQKRHPQCVNLMHLIPDIISKPDYIGNDPKKPNSFEVVKVYNDNLLVAVELDMDEHYLYVASFYDIKQSKLERRLNSGRLVRFK